MALDVPQLVSKNGWKWPSSFWDIRPNVVWSWAVDLDLSQFKSPQTPWSYFFVTWTSKLNIEPNGGIFDVSQKHTSRRLFRRLRMLWMNSWDSREPSLHEIYPANMKDWEKFDMLTQIFTPSQTCPPPPTPPPHTHTYTPTPTRLSYTLSPMRTRNAQVLLR